MTASAPFRPEADVALRDGSIVHIRPVRPDDEQELIRFLTGLSERSRWFRFFSAWANLGHFAEQAVDADPARRLDLVATTGDPERIVAHATSIRTDRTRAEVAFAVDDRLHGQGLATIMLGHLAQAAAHTGIETFEAITLPENHKMLGVFRESGFPTRIKADPDEISVEFPTSLTPDAVARFDRREEMAAAAAVRRLLHPTSIAVIGASRRPSSIGGAIFHNLVGGGFEGAVYPVNAKTPVVQSVAAYPTVLDVPGPVDLAVVVVPAEDVVTAARECAEKDVKGLVVISAGFAETGDEGAARQRELVRVCRSAGMGLIGPNCLGVVNTDPSVSMNATFAGTVPPPGRVGFLTQSGALALAVIDRAGQLGLGVSTFVSNGNKADISGNDLLCYWDEDERTDVILLYLESFGNPRKFSRIARRVGRRKPILVVKSGRSPAGARAASSHTGAMLQASDVTVDALFKQAGVVRCDTLAELLDVASLLSAQPAPAGNRVGIVTNAGGLGILCADACTAGGLAVVTFSPGLQADIGRHLAVGASTVNPVDMIASAGPDQYRAAIEVIAASDEVDAIVAIFIPPMTTRLEAVATAVREAAETIDAGPTPVPVVGVFMSKDLGPHALGRVPAFDFPEAAARALAHAARYGMWRAAPEGTVPAFDDVDHEAAAAVLATAVGEPGWLGPDQTWEVLRSHGLPMVDQVVAADPDDAAAAAEAIGGPVALKVILPGASHKTDVGGIRLDLTGADAVRREAHAMAEALGGAERLGFVVQRMAEPGIELLVGIVHDPLFGPVIALAAGGTAVELLGDAAVRLTPLTVEDADEMLRSLRTFPLLEGFRGRPGGDVDALKDLLLRVSALVEAHPEIAEMDCNPVIVHPQGATVVDARVRVAPARAPVPLGARASV